MKADVVVDVGNTRIKWGRCSASAVTEAVSLPTDDPSAWQTQCDRWQIPAGQCWVVSGVAPAWRDGLAAWLRTQKQKVFIIDSCRPLPLQVLVEAPDKVGIDRLLGAVAANVRRPPGRPAVVIDAGSAVTVDWIDEAGAFRGGAIFPGLRLMANALHDYTALLPRVDVSRPLPPVPGTTTPRAIEAGLYWSVIGGVQMLVARMTSAFGERPVVFLTGGDGPLLAPALDSATILWPQMILEGIRIAAESRSGFPA